MTQQQQPPGGPSASSLNPSIFTRPALAAALLGSLALYESSGRDVLVPYRDIGGVWTVCDGITGPAVVPGRTYTKSECDAMHRAAVAGIERRLLECVLVPMKWHVHWALLHWAYNVGAGAACGSTAVRMLNAGKTSAACDQLMRWTYVSGKDCKNKESRCGGIVKRRTFESEVCHARIPIPLLGEVRL